MLTSFRQPFDPEKLRALALRPRVATGLPFRGAWREISQVTTSILLV